MADRDNFLPDFCTVHSVFTVVVTAELLAFVLVLVQPDGGSWRMLGLVSLLVQWVALGSSAVLCQLRPHLARLSGPRAALASYALILIITAAVAEGAWWLARPLPATQHAPFVARALAVAAIAAAVVLRYLYVQHEWRHRLQSEAEARIDALQARIRPHFLFNSLNTIASMIATSPTTAERLVEDLADLFRASLTPRGRLVPLSDEIAMVEGYLRMEHERLGERLRIRWRVAAIPDDALIPPLTLQPLFENAVYYGIEPRRDGGTLTITGRRRDDELEIELSNPAPKRINRGGGFGMAQSNVRERLALAFGQAGRLTASEGEGVYHVSVRFPYRQGVVDENTHR
ncbi:sensor histidine kinase [Arhodomonas sp. AD133]|uniref:sensor histidine kinase n=1 Tax=Arhodomonas sp. AD133 TaxID=3415009 RepID=UPI003EC0E347